MKRESKDKDFIKKPIYPGGPKAMKQFISENLRYPQEALEKKIEGTVVLNFDIDHKGRVTDVRIISGLGHGCDEEAVRVVKLLRFDVPKNKLKVIFHKDIQIHFRLPKQAPETKAPIQLQYVTSSTPRTGSSEQNSSFTYTIDLGKK
ncbi:MAG: hypothetical protein KatS3mg030_147 [Saprospiraceae bacterium]|nr:MAG: hypothetical protein KatS3mg030_144 [Saprospiraceae bacterium]GIV31845.1 MAG: hypothetical protein KatS3mg030_147 [Saprospiraceae bacterium]